MALERELATYQKNLPVLLAQRGKFVLIHGETVEGVFDTREEALRAGYERHLQEEFLVKEILETEPVRFFSRNVKPCHHFPGNR